VRERVRRWVDAAGDHPRLVLSVALAAMAFFAVVASRLDVRSDLLELLPRDSPGFQAFEHQLGRVGGGATLIVIVESNDRAKNQAFVDDLARDLAERPDPRVAYVEAGTKDVRAFYEAHKWLYASLDDLEDADRTLDHEIAVRSGFVADLEDDPRDARAEPSGVARERPKKSLGMDAFVDRWEARAHERDAFPSGYFASEDGSLCGLRIVSTTTLGDARGDSLLAEVEARVRRLDPRSYTEGMRVGFTGDVASAADEKRALVSDAVWATASALVVVVAALVLYYRSPWAPLVIALPALFGVLAAYAFAEVVYGYVNTSGAFLGAIILGNGINYPIVLLSRYQEFRARGVPPREARAEATVNALRAELVGACVAAIAYGSLLCTRFRGFTQFGAIGFFGMLVVWASMVPIVPSMLVLVDRWQARLPRWLRDRPHALRTDGSRSAFASRLAGVSARWPGVILAASAAMTALAVLAVPAYLRDPWEYDFGKLGSKSSDVTGAGEWSNKANVVFGGKANIAGALMLADAPEQVPLLERAILENDRRDSRGPLIADITTIDDYLPGTPDEQRRKLEVLDRIGDRLTPRVTADMSPDERATLDRLRPPESLRVVERSDLPPLLVRRFTENDGRVGTILYVKPKEDVVFADGHNHLRLSATTDNVRLPDGTVVMTASRSTIFAEMLQSMRRDGPLASAAALACVIAVILIASRGARGAVAVLVALGAGATWLVGAAAWFDFRINYVNFIALPITLGIGCEYPFHIADRARLLGGDVAQAVRRSAGAVLLCSFTTIVGYGSLVLSDVQALASFGELAAFGEVACVAAAVLVVPSWLTVRGARGE